MASEEKSNFLETEECATYIFLGLQKVSCSPSEKMKGDFQNHGYVIVKNLFKPTETEKLMKAIETSKDFQNAIYGREDNHKLKYYMSLWLEPGNDVIGRATKTEKMIGVAEQLMDKGELYLFHGKVIMKDANTGGSFLWHQDYGYWYNYGCIFPDMMSVFVALTKNDETNGGLELLDGSHKCGRIDHGAQAGQTAADTDRVDLIHPKLKLVKCNFKPGDAIFFHANILHRSQANKSEERRWNIIWSLNTKYNNPDPVHYHHSAQYARMERLPIDAVEMWEDLNLEPRKYFCPS